MSGDGHVRLQIRRRPWEAFGPAPLGFPPTPPVDRGAGLRVGDAVTVNLGGSGLVSGVVTGLDVDWLIVEVP
jgi:hypothetical protein